MHSSQSLADSGVVPNASLRNGSSMTATCRASDKAIAAHR